MAQPHHDPRYVQAQQYQVRPPPPPPPQRGWTFYVTIGLCFVALLFLAASAGIYFKGRGQKTSNESEQAAAQQKKEEAQEQRAAEHRAKYESNNEKRSPQPTPKPADTRTEHEKFLAEANYEKALAFVVFDDVVDTWSMGAIMFAQWADQHLKWKDIGKPDETSYAKVMKDSDEERKKTACFSGSIGEILAQQMDGWKAYQGQMMMAGLNVISFIAVASTGDLVEGSSARFCGVVVGRRSFSNAGGGTTHSAMVVGMFDLPENKKR